MNQIAKMAAYDLASRSLYQNEPPDLQTKAAMNATLIVSWWCTGFAFAAILIRTFGRYVRTDKLFKEDKIAFWCLVPLFIRMGLVHVILIWGTNNTKTEGLTPIEIHHRSIGSRLVLASRIFYALFIWMAKWSILEFLKRLIGAFWHKTYEIGLQILRYFLVVTFIGVVISTLTECHPVSHYWQVVPDPGPKCRQGIAQLMTMGICDIITDILLVVFPIPIVIRSEMPAKRKISLVLLFALSLALVGVTAYRIPATISRKSSQQFRSLIASIEILAAAGITNAIVIGSFIRDRGVKKAKFKFASVSGESGKEQTLTRRATITAHHWGSDDDLAADLGLSLHPSLQSRSAPASLPPVSSISTMPRDLASGTRDQISQVFKVKPNWEFPNQEEGDKSEEESISTGSVDPKATKTDLQMSPKSINPSTGDGLGSKKTSFFDIGGLMESDQQHSPSAAQSTTPLVDSQQSSAQDLSTSPGNPLSTITSHHSSRAFISDIGGLLPHREEGGGDQATTLPPVNRTSNINSASQLGGGPRNFSRGGSAYNRSSNITEGIEPTPPYRPGRDVGGATSGPSQMENDGSMDFVDAGGLLK